MAEIVWTEPALQSLDEVADFIALDNPQAAQGLVCKVFQQVDLLSHAPEMGNIPAELKGTPYRRLVISWHESARCYPIRLFLFVLCPYILKNEGQLFGDDQSTARTICLPTHSQKTGIVSFRLPKTVFRKRIGRISL